MPAESVTEYASPTENGFCVKSTGIAERNLNGFSDQRQRERSSVSSQTWDPQDISIEAIANGWKRIDKYPSTLYSFCSIPNVVLTIRLFY